MSDTAARGATGGEEGGPAGTAARVATGGEDAGPAGTAAGGATGDEEDGSGVAAAGGETGVDAKLQAERDAATKAAAELVPKEADRESEHTAPEEKITKNPPATSARRPHDRGDRPFAPEVQTRFLRSTNRVLAPKSPGAAAASTAGVETAGGASEESPKRYTLGTEVGIGEHGVVKSLVLLQDDGEGGSTGLVCKTAYEREGGESEEAPKEMWDEWSALARLGSPETAEANRVAEVEHSGISVPSNQNDFCFEIELC